MISSSSPERCGTLPNHLFTQHYTTLHSTAFQSTVPHTAVSQADLQGSNCHCHSLSQWEEYSNDGWNVFEQMLHNDVLANKEKQKNNVSTFIMAFLACHFVSFDFTAQANEKNQRFRGKWLLWTPLPQKTTTATTRTHHQPTTTTEVHT